MTSGEFDLIAKYFKPLASAQAPAYGLSDDAAIYTPEPGHSLVFTKDALVSDVHFFANDPAELIAQKALRVNLSDLASMGAKPIGYLLSIALPKSMKNLDSWLRDFAEGLQSDQQKFDIELFGGDTVSTSGPLTLSLTAIGAIIDGKALQRAGAREGDDIYVSGTLGDSAFGLKILLDDILPKDEFLIDHYHLPRPRLDIGLALSGIATSAMDISDGLAGDIRHICSASQCGADINFDLIPVSESVSKILESFPQYKSLIVTGGDDYELLFTVPRDAEDQVRKISEDTGIKLTKIGCITDKPEINIKDEDGVNLFDKYQGFRHF